MTWKVTMANPDSDHNGKGIFRYWVAYKRDQVFNPNKVTWSCNTDDEFEYALYSFPQNLCKKHTVTNVRRRAYYGDFDDMVVIDLGAPVDNFYVYDPRINATSVDDQHFVLFFDQQDVPRGDGHAHEIHFEFDYRPGQFFLSNTVTVAGYSYDTLSLDAAIGMSPTN